MGDGSASRFDPKGKGRAQQNGDLLAMNLDAAEEGQMMHSSSFQQMELVEQQVRGVFLFILRSLTCLRTHIYKVAQLR